MDNHSPTSSTLQKMTPMMQQWHACKKIRKDAILFFRMGDFYEAFYDDALITSKELGLTLTKRQGTPMSGIPHHTIDSYIDKLVSKGFKVAIAEQMENPKSAKGIVKRDVVRIITPGTVVNSSLLSEKSNNFFVALDQVGSAFGLTSLDLTTSEFRVIELENKRSLLNEVYNLRPAEFLCSEKFKRKNQDLFNEIQQNTSSLQNTQEDWYFDHQTTYNFLTQHLQVHSLDSFGLKGLVAGINAAGALLAYIKDELRLPIEHIRDIKTYSASSYMSLDRTTQKNLELTESLQDGSRRNTLLEVLDSTLTPMGGRMLHLWLKQPLLSADAINERQDAVEALLKTPQHTSVFAEALGKVRDLERLIMRVTTGYATPKDLVSLRYSLEYVPIIKSSLKTFSEKKIKSIYQKLEDPSDISSLIAKALIEDPPIRVSDGNLFLPGYHRKLDELREISQNSKSWLANYQVSLREQTGIKTLKVGFTRVFGYYIEVSKGQACRMPETFHRRQTLVNTERFISPELKDHEAKVFSAEEKISSLEGELFLSLRKEVAKSSSTILEIANALAEIDCLHSLSSIARKYSYTRPRVDNSKQLNIQNGRHPIIEMSNITQSFIPNDTLMDEKDHRLFIITGPNMAGKSTYIRQVALLVIMAQIGSFIPSSASHIGIVDKVFARIGASDDLSRGQSTFMVEMAETANILNNASSQSLVILDEIGRGTSTYDGISIAWAVAEYLLTTKEKSAKTLFATHYWELTNLADKIPGAVNYNVKVREDENGIVFLHKILKGSTDKSYGIHVARLAGLPKSVIARSQNILNQLEENTNKTNTAHLTEKKKAPVTRLKNNHNEVQLLLFEPKSKAKHHLTLLSKLKEIDLNNLTPIQAHAKLVELKTLAT